MSSDDPPPGESFYERARTLNSNLQRLIEGIGGVLTASGELLARLQRLLGGTQPAAPDDQQPPPDDRPGD